MPVLTSCVVYLTFSLQEDATISAHVEQFGPFHWPKVAAMLGNLPNQPIDHIRSAKQCRER